MFVSWASLVTRRTECARGASVDEIEVNASYSAMGWRLQLFDVYGAPEAESAHLKASDSLLLMHKAVDGYMLFDAVRLPVAVSPAGHFGGELAGDASVLPGVTDVDNDAADVAGAADDEGDAAADSESDVDSSEDGLEVPTEKGSLWLLLRCVMSEADYCGAVQCLCIRAQSANACRQTGCGRSSCSTPHKVSFVLERYFHFIARIGGAVYWEVPVRFKHVATGRFLCTLHRYGRQRPKHSPFRRCNRHTAHDRRR